MERLYMIMERFFIMGDFDMDDYPDFKLGWNQEAEMYRVTKVDTGESRSLRSIGDIPKDKSGKLRFDKLFKVGD